VAIIKSTEVMIARELDTPVEGAPKRKHFRGGRRR